MSGVQVQAVVHDACRALHEAGYIIWLRLSCLVFVAEGFKFVPSTLSDTGVADLQSVHPCVCTSALLGTLAAADLLVGSEISWWQHFWLVSLFAYQWCPAGMSVLMLLSYGMLAQTLKTRHGC